MRHFKSEFIARVSEIENYYVFLKGMDSIETHNRSSQIALSSSINLKIDRGLQKVLRSYTFLLLYNLIESTLANGIVEIYDNIHDEKLNFNSISEEFQKIWLEINSKRLGENRNENKVQMMLKSIIDQCSDLNELSFENHRLSISGNLDFKTIEKIRSKYGFKGTIPNKDVKQLIAYLTFIKNKRNYLAHGNESFTKASELKTFSDIEKIKNEIIIYLTSIVDSIESLLAGKHFKKGQAVA